MCAWVPNRNLLGKAGVVQTERYRTPLCRVVETPIPPPRRRGGGGDRARLWVFRMMRMCLGVFVCLAADVNTGGCQPLTSEPSEQALKTTTGEKPVDLGDGDGTRKKTQAVKLDCIMFSCHFLESVIAFASCRFGLGGNVERRESLEVGNGPLNVAWAVSAKTGHGRRDV